MRSSWFKVNSFDNNEEYTEKVLKKFDIKKYHFVIDQYGCLALLIELGMNSYRIEADIDNCEMIIKKKNIRRLGQKHPKEYMREIKKFDKDAIYESIKFVKKDSEML